MILYPLNVFSILSVWMRTENVIVISKPDEFRGFGLSFESKPTVTGIALGRGRLIVFYYLIKPASLTCSSITAFE